MLRLALCGLCDGAMAQWPGCVCSSVSSRVTPLLLHNPAIAHPCYCTPLLQADYTVLSPPCIAIHSTLIVRARMQVLQLVTKLKEEAKKTQTETRDQETYQRYDQPAREE